MHWNFTNDAATVSVNLQENSSNGTVWGTVTYANTTFPVTGYWQAAAGGGIVARRVSNLMLSGQFDNPARQIDYISISGLIQGGAPNMGPMDLSFHYSSSRSGSWSQLEAHLATALSEPPPQAVSPPNLGGVDATWTLSSLDGEVTMRVNVGGSGAVSGTLSVGNEFTVNGQWAASGVDGRTASAFEVTGRHAVSPGAEDLLAAAGIMTGPGHWPQMINVSGNIASISEYKNTPFQAKLLPMWSNDSAALAAAYAESYMVIQLGGTGGDSQAVRGWIGPRGGNQIVSPFGGDYKTNGSEMSAEQLADIVSPDTNHADTNDIKIPSFNSASGSRPVMIQFVGDVDHFPQPPLQEYHQNVTKMFYDEEAGALVLQFADKPGGGQSELINFNHGHGPPQRPQP
jgi:hypothetical protein